jgi:hypothetical protein
LQVGVEVVDSFTLQAEEQVDYFIQHQAVYPLLITALLLAAVAAVVIH